MPVARWVGHTLVVAALLATAACGHDNSTARPAPQKTSGYSSYVALGDSYVAGPGIRPVDPTSGGCARSLNNWPTLLAKTMHVTSLYDVSCSGATSADILTARPSASAVQPDAQIDAVRPDTDLVTIGIGGNDEGVFGRIIFSCAGGSTITPPRTCSPDVSDELTAVLDRTTSRVALTLQKIRDRAPDARIILVGYLRVMPELGGCVVHGVSPDRSRAALAGQDALDQALEEAARRARVEYVSMGTLSAGHAACDEGDAWVNGVKPLPGDGSYIHPNTAGMQAVAAAVARAVGKPTEPSAAASTDR